MTDNPVYAEKTYAVLNDVRGNFWFIIGTDKKHYIVSTDANNEIITACKELEDLKNFDNLQQTLNRMWDDYIELRCTQPEKYGIKPQQQEPANGTNPEEKPPEGWFRRIFKKQKRRRKEEMEVDTT
jgi:hypothetical protein